MLCATIMRKDMDESSLKRLMWHVQGFAFAQPGCEERAKVDRRLLLPELSADRTPAGAAVLCPKPGVAAASPPASWPLFP